MIWFIGDFRTTSNHIGLTREAVRVINMFLSHVRAPRELILTLNSPLITTSHQANIRVSKSPKHKSRHRLNYLISAISNDELACGEKQCLLLSPRYRYSMFSCLTWSSCLTYILVMTIGSFEAPLTWISHRLINE